jgi:ATP-dependent DNA helicase RecG
MKSNPRDSATMLLETCYKLRIMDDPERLIALVDELCANAAEGRWVEYKLNSSEPDRIGRYISAIANAARLADKPSGYVLWGVEDESREIKGTSFDPSTAKKGNEALEFWLSKRLDPKPYFQFKEIDHPQGRVVVLEIEAATHAPIKFIGLPYIRVGDATPVLGDHPEQEARLWSLIQSYAWETGIAKQYVAASDVVALLETDAYFNLTNRPIPEDRTGILEALETERLVAKDIGGKWNILNLGAILLARDLSSFDRISRKAVRVIEYHGRSRVRTKRERMGVKGYAASFPGLIRYINDMLPRNELIGQALREEQVIYPELALRELVANALIHQDMTISGTGPMIEIFDDRVEITNPGQPLVEPMRFLDSPPRSRNEAVASLMRRMNMCEERGSGIDKVIFEVEYAQLPPPDFEVQQSATRATLFAPRPFAAMTPSERVRACYQHTALLFVSGDRATNSTLRNRFGIKVGNASQVSRVFKDALHGGVIKLADPSAPRAGYVPYWG